MSTAATPPARGAAFLARRRRNYFLFIAPALVVVGAVIIFPWLYTIWMSAFDWTIGSTAHYVGLGNYEKIFTSRRFGEAVLHTFYFTGAGGDRAARHRHVGSDGLPPRVPVPRRAARPLHHADDGDAGGRRARVDDDVPPAAGRAQLPLSLVGLPPSLWVYSPTLVIPSLVLVEVWHWTPLVMLIVLGGLAALPTEPYESARLDGATEWQLFPVHHAAARRAVHPGCGGHPDDRCAQGIRHDLRDHGGGPARLRRRSTSSCICRRFRSTTSARRPRWSSCSS
jgi:multiple sugar transport system permease protein